MTIRPIFKPKEIPEKEMFSASEILALLKQTKNPKEGYNDSRTKSHDRLEV